MSVSKQVFSLLLIAGIIYASFYFMMPQQVNVPKKANQFSVTKATEHVRNMAEKPHFVGAPAHKEVINYLEKALQNLGLEPNYRKDIALEIGVI